MSQTDAQTRYESLRGELERAYNAPVWNSQRIDQIADELARIEWRAFSRHAVGALNPFAVETAESM